jgi:hypothetical protein
MRGGKTMKPGAAGESCGGENETTNDGSRAWPGSRDYANYFFLAFFFAAFFAFFFAITHLL